MIFHHKQRNIENLIPQLNLNEQIIKRVTDFDFLGLTIDQHLTWNGHVQKISNKISRSLGIMCKLKRFLPQNILKILYNSLILPHLQYCMLSWGFKSDRIFKLQKRAVRIITCSKYNAHTESLLKRLNLLKIEDIMKTKALKLYYRYKQNELPNILNQCSLNQMIIIHMIMMILDISLFYINYQQRQALDGYV